MIESTAYVIVLLVAVFQLGLAAVCFFTPQRAIAFLGAFASSRKAHLIEMALRLVAGGAFVVHAPVMRFPTAFLLFGWAMVASTVVLLILPWRMHQQFAEKYAAPVIGKARLMGGFALALGGVILYAAWVA